MKSMICGIDGRSWMAIAILSFLAIAWPSDARAAECQFAIIAVNDLDGDVWFDLYDSTVFRPNNLLAGRVQLKIQNQRVPPGKKLDRRYTAAGKCDAKRSWYMVYRVTVNGKLIKGGRMFYTEGTSSTSRTVDLGRTSRLPPEIT